jgi:hypothetical protein
MNCRMLWVVWAVVVLTALPCFGGQDPGVADTVRIGCPYLLAFEPDSMTIPIYLWNDEPISGLTLGFRIIPNSFRLSSWKVIDTDIPPITQANFSVNYNADSSTVLLGWVDLSGTNPVTATTTSTGRRLVTLYLRCSPSSHATDFRIDSTFIPPAGSFLLVGPAQGFIPEFVGCEFYIDGINEESATRPMPSVPTLNQNSPNPFNSSTAITFDVPRPANVQLDIVSVLGEKVTTLVNHAMLRGQHQIVWDGKDRFGNAQPSGVYFYRLTVGTLVQTRKMVLLK